MIDVHAHILYGIDDGSKTSEAGSEATSTGNISNGTSEAESADEETRRTAQKQQEQQTMQEQQTGEEEQPKETTEGTSSEESSGASGESGMWSNDAEIKDVMGLKVSNDGESVVISYKTKHSNPWDYSYH